MIYTLWLGFGCVVTPARTPSYIKMLLCTVMWGLSSAMISCLNNGMHPPEVDINPLKMMCGCPCGGVITDSHTSNLLPYRIHLLVYNHTSNHLPYGTHLLVYNHTSNHHMEFICQCTITPAISYPVEIICLCTITPAISFPIEIICQYTVAYTGLHPEFSAGEHYNNRKLQRRGESSSSRSNENGSIYAHCNIDQIFVFLFYSNV